MSYQATLRSNIIAEIKRHKDDLDGFIEDMMTPQKSKHSMNASKSCMLSLLAKPNAK